MKTTCNWLGEYCDHGLSPEELAHRLTLAGLPVESVGRQQADCVIEVEVTPNRPDLLGTLGIARELAALTHRPLRRPTFSLAPGKKPVEELVGVEILDAALCPRYTARIITGVKVGPSPAWLAERLALLAVRPVNNIVDITNYVLLECGQPLHAFDFDKLTDGRVVVRRARPGERLVTLDGRERELSDEMLVIADARRAVAVAGVMGGFETEISGRTQNVLLESAQFEGAQIRRTSRKLGLSSDSSYRFERGVDPLGVEWASRRAAAMIAEMAGGQVTEGVVDVWPGKPQASPRHARLRLSRLHQLLGLDIPPDRAMEVLRSLEFSVKATDDADVLDVTIPSFRGDVSLEVDLIEEVARIHGYDRIPDRTELKLVHVVSRTKSDRICEEVRAVLSGMGFYEVITNSFTDAPRAALISPWTDAPPLPFNNTIRCEEGLLRLSLLPGLLQTKAANLARGILQTQLFEIGAVFLPRQGEKLPEERTCLALLDEEGFLALKGVLEAVARVSGLGGDLRLTGCAHSLFEPSHAAEVSLEGQRLWVLGDLDGKLSEEMGFKAAPALAEVNLDLVIERSVLERRFSKLPVYPASSRDIALVVDEAVTWETVEQWVRQAGGELLEDVRFFDLYRGKQVPEGKKSLAFRLTFRAPDRTLTGQEVDGIWEVVVEALKKQLGATLRSI